MLSLQQIGLSFFVAVFTIVFTELLTDEGSILGFYGKLLRRLPEWLSSPLGACSYCFGGQLALWGYIYLKFHYMWRYDWVNHLFFVMLTIFFIHLLNKIWNILYD